MHTRYTCIQDDNSVIIEIYSDELNIKNEINIKQEIANCITKNNSLIINLKNVKSITSDTIDSFLETHDLLYNSHSLSFVICEAEHCKNLYQESENLNITPTLQEAKDIVNMEVIERELLGDDDIDL